MNANPLYAQKIRQQQQQPNSSSQRTPIPIPRTQPNLHPQAIDPRTGAALAGSGGGPSFSEQQKDKHLSSIKKLYIASSPAGQNSNLSFETHPDNTVNWRNNASAYSKTADGSTITVKPDGRVIWNTAPFFNKGNITPRVNVFFGCGGGNGRDEYMSR